MQTASKVLIYILLELHMIHCAFILIGAIYLYTSCLIATIVLQVTNDE